MAIPSMNVTIQDFALGIAPSNINSQTKFGFSSGGQRGVLAGFADAQTMKTSHGVGPIVDSASHTLAVAGGTVYLFPIEPAAGWSSPATTALTRAGVGPGTVTVTPAIWRKTKVRILLGGAVATATYQISIDDGVTYLPTVYVTAATKALDHTMTMVTWTAGAYVANEIYTFNTDGTITQSGAGPLPTSTSLQSSPTDSYAWYLTIKVGGAAGVATFQYSLDGGITLSPVITVPAGGKYVIPNAGAYFLFAAGPFTATDTYTDPATPSAPVLLFASGDVTTQTATLLANSTEWDHVHYVQTWSTAANAATAATAAGVQMTAAQNAFRYTYAVIECKQEADATIIAAVAAVSELRVAICAGDEDLFSSLTGLAPRRNSAWPATARAQLIPPGEDAAWVGRGALPAIRQLYRDEAKTTGLDDARLTTLRTHIGLPGFYITNFRMMSPPGSDFQYVQHRRVMDRACRASRQALLPFLNGGIRVDAVTGRINDEDASRIEARTNAILRSVLVDTGNVSAVSVLIDRSNNILSTNTLKVTIRITPLGYMKTIELNIGYENPALLNAA